MIDHIPPAPVFILGALLVPFLKGRLKDGWLLLLPLISFGLLLASPPGTEIGASFLGFELVFFRVDRLSLVFGYIFHLIAFIGVIYALNFRDDLEYVAGLAYAGSALGVVFAGDWFTFFVFWEMLTICAVPLIWARRTGEAQAAGFRYLMVHVGGGLLLLAGIVMHIHEQGSVALTHLGLSSPATWCIFLGMGINAAWPFLHAWLPDAYPQATIAGTVFMSALTTKTAVYALARTFAGTEILIWIGAAMTAFPIFYAVIENDLRKVLSYSLINQVGFMMVGIGIGTELAINGAAAHAFAHILYKSLLFMSMGAVLFRTGKINATDLGGLYKSMPWTAFFCIIGAASISSFPLTSGFVSKSMVVDAAAQGHYAMVWLFLIFASAGVFHHSGIKIPFFAFFSHDAGHRVKEAPANMLVAMGIAAFFCIFIGVWPGFLYGLLPYPVEYVPYTAPHVVFQLQLLLFSALAFTLLLLSGIYPAELRAINLDVDWFYRRGCSLTYAMLDEWLNGLNAWTNRTFALGMTKRLSSFFKDGPARLVMAVARPAWELTGIEDEEGKRAEARFLDRFRTGFFSVGSAAFFALALFLLLFILLAV